MRLGGHASDAGQGFHVLAVAAVLVMADRVGAGTSLLGVGLVRPNKAKGLDTSCPGRRGDQSPQATIEKRMVGPRRHQAATAVEDAGYQAAAAEAAAASTPRSGTGE